MPTERETRIASRRLDVLREAIRARADWEQIEFLFDNARSAVDRAMGVRQRPYDNQRDRDRVELQAIAGRVLRLSRRVVSIRSEAGDTGPGFADLAEQLFALAERRQVRPVDDNQQGRTR